MGIAAVRVRVCLPSFDVLYITGNIWDKIILEQVRNQRDEMWVDRQGLIISLIASSLWLHHPGAERRGRRFVHLLQPGLRPAGRGRGELQLQPPMEKPCCSCKLTRSCSCKG